MENTTEMQAAAADKRPASGPDFTTSFTVDQSPEQAYAAIINVRGWWSENIEGPTDEPNGEWVYHNEPVHVARFRVTELVPGRRVAWRVLENDLSFIEDKTEWVGNEMIFDISRKGDKTEVTFTQIGLVPEYE